MLLIRFAHKAGNSAAVGQILRVLRPEKVVFASVVCFCYRWFLLRSLRYTIPPKE